MIKLLSNLRTYLLQESLDTPGKDMLVNFTHVYVIELF